MSTAAPRKILLLCTTLLLVATSSACRRELAGRPAPESDLYFPLGMTLSPDGRTAYVISTNWSQRFNTGWLSVIDLDAIASGAAATPADAIRQTLLVPSLGGELSMSPDGKLLAGSFRNNNQIIVFEIHDDGLVDCGDPDGETGLDAGDRRTDCDGRHVYRFAADGLDKGFIVDQYRDPFGLRFLPPHTDTPQQLMVGYLSNYLGLCLVSFLDVDLAGETEILSNQRSIELTQNIVGLTVQSSAIVAPRPAGPAEQRYVAVGARTATAGVTSATLYSINFDDFSFTSTDSNEFITADFNNRAKVGRIDLRAQSGGFTIADMVFSPDAQYAFAAISFSQPATGSSDSVLMLDARPRSRDVLLANDELVVVQRPEYDVIDTLAVPGTPQSLSYIERLSASPLLVTATFDDNALHFVRVGPASLDSITRIDRSVGEGPVTVRHARFAPSSTGVMSDFVVVTSFLNHAVYMFDVTAADPSQWTETGVESTLKDGRRFR